MRKSDEFEVGMTKIGPEMLQNKIPLILSAKTALPVYPMLRMTPKLMLPFFYLYEHMASNVTHRCSGTTLHYNGGNKICVPGLGFSRALQTSTVRKLQDPPL